MSREVSKDLISLVNTYSHYDQERLLTGNQLPVGFAWKLIYVGNMEFYRISTMFHAFYEWHLRSLQGSEGTSSGRFCYGTFLTV